MYYESFFVLYFPDEDMKTFEIVYAKLGFETVFQG